MRERSGQATIPERAARRENGAATHGIRQVIHVEWRLRCYSAVEVGREVAALQAEVGGGNSARARAAQRDSIEPAVHPAPIRAPCEAHRLLFDEFKMATRGDGWRGRVAPRDPAIRRR